MKMQLTRYSKPVTVIALLAILSLAGSSISAQKPRKSDPCANPQTQIEMTQCAANAYKVADGVWNQVYQKLVAMLDDEEKTQLKEAQPHGSNIVIPTVTSLPISSRVVPCGPCPMRVASKM